LDTSDIATDVPPENQLSVLKRTRKYVVALTIIIFLLAGKVWAT